MHVAIIGNEWQGTRRCLLQLADDIIPRKIDQEDFFLEAGLNNIQTITKKYLKNIRIIFIWNMQLKNYDIYTNIFQQK